MTNYPHLLARVFNTPLMVAPDKARVIVAGLAARLGVAAEPANQLPDLAASVPGARQDARKPYAITDRGVACISVIGTLAHNAATASPPSGLTTYGEIEAEIEDAATDPGVRAILLDIDSCGGEASDSSYALADRIREARAIKPVWAAVDEMACSAAYLLASQCSRIMCPPGGYVGSIGVYALHLDQSGFDKKNGLTWTYIYAGAHKVDGNPHEPLDDATRAFLQADVDRTYERFLEAVGAGRPALGAKGARATEARYFRGDQAVAAGLSDGVMDFRETLAEITASLDKPRTTFVAPRAALATPSSEAAPAGAAADHAQPEAAAAAAEPPQETRMDTNTTGAAAASATAANTAGSAGNTSGGQVVDINAARGEGYAQAREITELCALAGFPGKAAEFLAANLSAADVRQKLAALRASGPADHVSSAITAGAGTNMAAGGEAPVVREAKKLADSMNKARAS